MFIVLSLLSDLLLALDCVSRANGVGVCMGLVQTPLLNFYCSDTQKLLQHVLGFEHL